jgi:hypothetical protein
MSFPLANPRRVIDASRRRSTYEFAAFKATKPDRYRTGALTRSTFEEVGPETHFHQPDFFVRCPRQWIYSGLNFAALNKKFVDDVTSAMRRIW